MAGVLAALVCVSVNAWGANAIASVAHSGQITAGREGRVTSEVRLRRAGTSIRLAHAAATRFVPANGPARLHLVLASDPLADLRAANEFGEDMAAMTRWAAEREAVVLILSLTEDGPANYMGTLAAGATHQTFAGRRRDDAGTIPRLAIEGGRITGRLAIREDAAEVSGDFDVPVETVAEVPFIEGAAAGTPQGEVLVAYATALTRLDMSAAQAFSTASLADEFAAARQDLGEKFVIQMIAERYGDPATLERELGTRAASFRQSGDRAQIRLTRPVPGAAPGDRRVHVFSFVRVDGRWKVR